MSVEGSGQKDSVLTRLLERVESEAKRFTDCSALYNSIGHLSLRCEVGAVSFLPTQRRHVLERDREIANGLSPLPSLRDNSSENWNEPAL